MLTNRQEVIFFSVLGAILITLLGLAYFFGNRPPEEDPTAMERSEPLSLQNISVGAKAVYVLDTYSGKVLYAKNENQRLPLASLTKMMSALVAAESAPEWSTVGITREAVSTDGDAGLNPGERWLLKDLLDFSLVGSANDGVRAVALALGSIASANASTEEIVDDFVQKMNVKAETLGMLNTYYINDTGLDESDIQGGAYGSAKDQAMLLNYILREYPNLLGATKESSVTVSTLNGTSHTVANTNPIVHSIPGLVASKTGFTDLAGGNLVVAFDPEIGRPIIISILGSTSEGRFNDMLTLVNASLDSVQNSVRLE